LYTGESREVYIYLSPAAVERNNEKPLKTIAILDSARALLVLVL
jgi:hypothetical protein